MPDNYRYPKDPRDEVVKNLIMGLTTDGAHHKQYYLEEAFRFDSAIKNNPVMSKSVEKRVLVQIQDIVKSLNLHCKMEDEHE